MQQQAPMQGEAGCLMQHGEAAWKSSSTAEQSNRAEGQSSRRAGSPPEGSEPCKQSKQKTNNNNKQPSSRKSSGERGPEISGHKAQYEPQNYGSPRRCGTQGPVLQNRVKFIEGPEEDNITSKSLWRRAGPLSQLPEHSPQWNGTRSGTRVYPLGYPW